jgi:protein TonB
MPSRVDIVAIVVALVGHGALAAVIVNHHPAPPRKPEVVEFDVRKIPPPPPPVTPPVIPEAKPEPPKPEPKIVHKIAVPEYRPPPNATPPKEPPKEPPKPVFGVSMSSTTDSDSTVSVPVGNTTMIDPSKSGKSTNVAPLPAAPAQPAPPEYKPVSELYVKSRPDIDTEACGNSVRYPEEAESLGIEGEVTLEIDLDDKGAPVNVKVIKGLGHGLDQLAVRAIKTRRECKFSPAISNDGKAVPFVVRPYQFQFQIPR